MASRLANAIAVPSIVPVIQRPLLNAIRKTPIANPVQIILDKRLAPFSIRTLENLAAIHTAITVAKNVVASKISEKCLIQLAYAIGVSKPLSIYVDLFDNDLEKNKYVQEKIKENFDLSPRGIREMLGLNKPIYEKTAAYGHFGRSPENDGSFSWEKTDKASVFSK